MTCRLLCRYRKTPLKEAAREEVPHSTCEGREGLVTGREDYLPLPLPPPSAVAPRQPQERMSNVLLPDSDGAERRRPALRILTF